MIRVLNTLFEDRYGGPQKRVIDVGKSLIGLEVETILLLPLGNGNAASIAENNGLKVVRVPFTRTPKPRALWKVLKWLLLMPRDVSAITQQFQIHDIGIVHVNGSFFLAPALAAKMARRPLVWHLNDTVLSTSLARFFGMIVKWLADEVVVAAEAVARHYGVSDHPHTVIYAPVDVKKIFPKPYQDTATSDVRPLRVGLIANWNPLKGLEVFVEATAFINEHLENGVEFVVAGSRLDSHADYAASVDHLINQYGLEKSIHTYGFVNDMQQFLLSLDVLVLSSWSEACPMAVLEGMAAGLPVVATDVGGVRELLRPDDEEQAGFVVAAGDSSQMAEKVLELLNDYKLRYRMGACGRKAAEQRFSLEACAAVHLKVYRSTLERSEQ